MTMLRMIKFRFILSIFASIVIIALSAFQWSIIDIISPFLYFPLAHIVGLFFIGVAIISLTALLKFRQIGMLSLAPIGIQIIAFLIITFVPFTNLWLKVDFSLKKEQREEVIRKVNKGELKPNVSHNSSLIALRDSYPLLSRGGNEIVVEEHDEKKYIFFYTFRGILDNYSGFIYVPDGGDPSQFSELCENESTQIVPLEKNWFYVSHH